MKVLVIDTTLGTAQAGIFADNKLLAQESRTGGKGQAEILNPLLENVLKQGQLTWRDIEQIVVTIGPGVFTGLRIGIAAARALRLALKVPLKGVSCLQVLAAQANARGKILALIDAHKNEVYAQHFSASLQPHGEPQLLGRDALTHEFHQAETAAIYPAALARELAQNFPNEVKKFIGFDALDLAAILRSAELSSCADPMPLYVRAPDALPQKGALKRA